jgi:hypothetical protein
VRSRSCVFAVTGTIKPVAFAGVVLDPKIVSDGDQFGVALPPLSEHALRSIAPAQPTTHTTPGE